MEGGLPPPTPPPTATVKVCQKRRGGKGFQCSPGWQGPTSPSPEKEPSPRWRGGSGRVPAGVRERGATVQGAGGSGGALPKMPPRDGEGVKAALLLVYSIS